MSRKTLAVLDMGSQKIVNLLDPTAAQDAASKAYADKAFKDGRSFIIDGGGAVIITGSKGYIEIPFACTITACRLFGDVSGSIVVDILRATYANFPTTSTLIGVTGTKPTLSSAQKSEDTTLTNWSTSLAAGDVLEFSVVSASSLKRVTLALTLQRV